ncbi:MAG TPA: YwiC-like family protein [Bacteroidia bacterium]|nr:YwiC-like family protein [Bacteroidia bacterium]
MKIPKSFLPVFWSKQHGAYITLLFCWLICVCLSADFHREQAFVLFFLLSGLNLVELIVESYRRKSPFPVNKRIWFGIYLFLTLFFGIVVLLTVPLFLQIMPVFVCAGIVFILLALKRKQKSLLAEWITFAVFALAGCLAYFPESMPDVKIIISLTGMMAIYFGLSIFIVKSWLSRLPEYAGLIYVMLALVIMFFFYNSRGLLFSVGFLMLLKATVPPAFKNWFHQLAIKKIGMMEAVYHLVFLILLILFKSEIV